MADALDPEAIPRLKSWPVPLRLTVCVLPATSLLLSVMVIEPERVPVAVGVNVTLIVQLPPAATLDPQLLVWAKSPLAVMLVMLRPCVPRLFSVTPLGLEAVLKPWPENVRLVVERLAIGAIPVPLRLAVCVLPVAPLLLSVTVKVPVSVPPVLGVNVMLIVHDPPATTLAPQSLV